jgi:hypothetical protein
MKNSKIMLCHYLFVVYSRIKFYKNKSHCTKIDLMRKREKRQDNKRRESIRRRKKSSMKFLKKSASLFHDNFGSIFPFEVQCVVHWKKKVSQFATNSKPFLGFVLSCETITKTFQASRNLFQRFRIYARKS